MRKLQIVLGLLATAALVLTFALAGCGKQAQETADGGLEDSAMPPGDTGEAMPGGEAPDTQAEPQTLADIMKRWPSSFVMKMTIEDTESGQTHETVMTMKMGDEGPEKIKMQAAEELGTMVIDYQEKMMYAWDEGEGQGMQVPLTEAEAQDPANPYDNADPNAKITGSETVDGVDCWVVETSEDGETVTSYVAKDTGLVKKVEHPRGTITYEYAQINEVPDSAFEVPSDIEMMDLSDVEGMRDMPIPEMEGTE